MSRLAVADLRGALDVVYSVALQGAHAGLRLHVRPLAKPGVHPRAPSVVA